MKIPKYMGVALIVGITLSISLPLSSYFFMPANYSVTMEKPLKDHACVPVGTAIDVDGLRNDPAYRELVATQFNSFTPENVMKMGPLRPDPNTFDFEDADFLVSFAEERGIVVHGHCLVWHQQLPSWIHAFNGTRDEWRALLKTHVQGVVGHFKGRVASWDVVNEAFDENGFRDTIWYRNIGEEYIADAFRWARESDPNATLYYNDFGLSSNGGKLDIVLSYINESIHDGVPIDGIGFQAHITASSPSFEQIEASVQKVNQLGLEFRVSELDITMNAGGAFPVYSQYLSDLQRERYYQVTRAFLEADGLAGITTWGAADHYSWIPGFRGHVDWPLLFDDQCNPKPAASAFAEVLEESCR